MTERVKINCDDCKFVEDCVDYGWYGCKKLRQKASEPLTNEEWFCQLPTEEKADFLANSYPKSVGEALIKISNGDKEKWVKWLKEEHHADAAD